MDPHSEHKRDGRPGVRTVWKYDLTVGIENVLEIPCASPRIVHVAAQYDHPGELQMWVEVHPDGPSSTRSFVIVGTGHPIPIGGTYVGTAITDGGRLIWHVYEVAR